MFIVHSLHLEHSNYLGTNFRWFILFSYGLRIISMSSDAEPGFDENFHLDVVGAKLLLIQPILPSTFWIQSTIVFVSCVGAPRNFHHSHDSRPKVVAILVMFSQFLMSGNYSIKVEVSCVISFFHCHVFDVVCNSLGNLEALDTNSESLIIKRIINLILNILIAFSCPEDDVLVLIELYKFLPSFVQIHVDGSF